MVYQVIRGIFTLVDIGMMITSLVIGVQLCSTMLVGDALRKLLRAAVVGALFSSTLFTGLAVVLGVDALMECIFPEDMVDPYVVFLLSTISIVQFLLKTAAGPWLSRPRLVDESGKNVVYCNHTSPSSTETDTESIERITTVRNRRLPGGRGSIGATFHPSSFRQALIEASRSQMEWNDDDTNESESENEGIIKSAELNPLIHHANIRETGTNNHHHHDFTGDSPTQAKRQTKKPRIELGSKLENIWDAGEFFWALAVCAASAAIWQHPHTSLEYLDPALGLLASVLALWYAVPVTRAAARILFHATPAHVDLEDLREDLLAVPGVVSVHHLHVWALDDSRAVATGHIQLAASEPVSWKRVAPLLMKAFHCYRIHSVTLQPEFFCDHEICDESDHMERISRFLS
ncbi:cation efflux protein [Xylariales sp. PMI_506]|nr:cation efflux protein [Xylariales sp. PMI_506]